MRLRAIQATNYRTLANLSLNFPPAYCTLSGKNNAGKSCIVKLLANIFGNPHARIYSSDEYAFEYKEDLTQWVKDSPPITVKCSLGLSRADDPALITFVEKVTRRDIHASETELDISVTVAPDNTISTALRVDGAPTDEQSAKETLTRLKGSNALVLHNSTTRQDAIYYGRGRLRAFYQVFLSVMEQQEVTRAEKIVQTRIRKLAREHRNELNAMLGKLTEKYDVEFSALESSATRRMPLGINLRDKNVEVPLNDWGSGTQNRTYILMSILSANRIRTQQNTEDKITPIIVIEEPESFLHPSAQAEFGKLLQAIASELGIQIIASTHSPYMLESSRNVVQYLVAEKVCI
jgi:putative ATP-dependent endonuclease of OLD family